MWSDEEEEEEEEEGEGHAVLMGALYWEDLEAMGICYSSLVPYLL